MNSPAPLLESICEVYSSLQEVVLACEAVELMVRQCCDLVNEHGQWSIEHVPSSPEPESPGSSDAIWRPVLKELSERTLRVFQSREVAVRALRGIGDWIAMAPAADIRQMSLNVGCDLGADWIGSTLIALRNIGRIHPDEQNEVVSISVTHSHPDLLWAMRESISPNIEYSVLSILSGFYEMTIWKPASSPSGQFLCKCVSLLSHSVYLQQGLDTTDRGLVTSGNARRPSSKIADSHKFMTAQSRDLASEERLIDVIVKTIQRKNPNANPKPSTIQALVRRCLNAKDENPGAETMSFLASKFRGRAEYKKVVVQCLVDAGKLNIE